jgi:hypothetical protein
MPPALPQSSFTPHVAHAFRRSLSYQGLDPRHDLTTLASTGRFERPRWPPSTTSPAPALGTPVLRKVPIPFASVRPQALSASRRFAPRSGLRACCIPQPCSGPPPFRGILSPCSSALSSMRLAPLPFSLCMLTGCPAATHRDLGFEALFRTKQRCTNKAVSPASARSPPRFPAPPGAPSLAGRPVLLGPFRS